MSAIVKGSLSDVTQRDNLTLAESFLHCDAMLIIDTSGSMSTMDAPGGISRHQAAQEQLSALQQQLPGKIAVVSFSDGVQFCPSGIPHRFNGNTDMVKALQFVKPADNTGIKFILISDGYPDNPRQTLTAAGTFKSKVDTVFIGPEHDAKGRRFLEKLANSTGGTFAQSAAPAMLHDPVERLLLATG